MPPQAYLVGGTAIAARLGHRTSRDLDFFMDASFDSAALAERLGSVGTFAVTRIGPGTLNGYLDQTKVQFLAATDQHPVEPDALIVGMRVASLADLLATKLKVIGDRGELRDYFDILVIERDGGRRVEEGLDAFVRRYRPVAPEAALLHVIRGLGTFADVMDDPSLPMRRRVIEGYWSQRVPDLLRALDRR